MPPKRKSYKNQSHQAPGANNNNNKKQSNPNQHTVSADEPPTAAETLLDDLFAENTKLVRDKTATLEDVNSHVEKLHALVLKFGASLTPVSSSICDALAPFLLARPPTPESAWSAAASASVLIPSVGATMFPLIVDHLGGCVDIQLGRIAATSSFTKEHAASVIRDIFFRDLANVLAASTKTSSSSSSSSSSTSSVKIRTCLRRIAMTALPLVKPDHRVRYCFSLAQILSFAATNNNSLIFSDETAKTFYTNKTIEAAKSSVLIDLLELAASAVLLSRPSSVGVLIEAIHNLVSRVKTARWCSGAVSLQEACLNASGVCSAVLHPVAAPSLNTKANNNSANSKNEPSGMMIDLLSNSNSASTGDNTNQQQQQIAPSPIFARSAIMPSALLNSTDAAASTSNTTSATVTFVNQPVVVDAMLKDNNNNNRSSLSGLSRSAPARRSRSKSRPEHENSLNNNNNNNNDDAAMSDMSDWGEDEDDGIEGEHDAFAHPNVEDVKTLEEQRNRRERSKSAAAQQNTSNNNIHHRSSFGSNNKTRIPAPSPAPHNQEQQQQGSPSSSLLTNSASASGNMMFSSSSSSATTTNNSSSNNNNNRNSSTSVSNSQQQQSRSRAISRGQLDANNNSTSSLSTTIAGKNGKQQQQQVSSTSPTPGEQGGVPSVDAAQQKAMSQENKNNNDDDDDDDAGTIEI